MGMIARPTSYLCDPEKATTCEKTHCVHNKDTRDSFCDQTTYPEWAKTDKHGNPIIAPREGLRHKYNVFKAETGEPVENCFVLRPDRDLAARKALYTYLLSINNIDLADDLHDWLCALEGRNGKEMGVTILK